jgi:hypothetical protein
MPPLLEPKALLRRIVTQPRDEVCGIRARMVARAGASQNGAPQNGASQKCAEDDYGTASTAVGRGTDKGSTCSKKPSTRRTTTACPTAKFEEEIASHSSP